MTIPLNSGRDYITWTFDFALSTFYEIETNLIQALIPPRLTPVEVAPEVSLINLTSFNFPKGALGTLPEFQELILSAIVSPDLSRSVPKFAMYVISLGSTCQEHLDHSADYYKLPIYDLISDVTIISKELIVSYGDSHGTILTMKNCSPLADFKEQERYFQVFTSEDDTIYIADVFMIASLFEHQLSGNVGVLHNHPFMKNLEVEDAEPVSYLQMINKPGKIGQQFYFRPERFI